jgi:hypothetical protein
MLRASHIVDSVRNRDEESIYPARISPRDDDYAPLVVQTLPPEVDDEDFQIPKELIDDESSDEIPSNN